VHTLTKPAAPGQWTCATRRLDLETHGSIDFIDITDRVAASVRATGLVDGSLTVCSQHTTAAIRIQEAEPCLVEDLRLFLERHAPPSDHYHHNDFRVRTVNMHPGERANGHSHCLQLLLGSSESIAVQDGELQLGEWQRLFLVELDGPRERREVVVQVLGVAR
jgi:secondary thiamine-phosphate synthase enzyme